MAIPLLNGLEITGKTITVDALLTQRTFARYLVDDRHAHYVFTVKDNQPNLLADIRLLFAERGAPDFSELPTLAHGRIETRSIWTSTALNAYLDFPGVGQVFCIERQRVQKRTGKTSTEIIYGLTSHHPETADAPQLLTLNRGHWTIENSSHWILDWNWDEDRSTIRTGHGPENTTRLRRFAIGVIKSRTADGVASAIRKLQRNVRLVFDYLRMTGSSLPPSGTPELAGG